jgi:hypothetical protein
VGENTRIIVAGLREGINFPKGKYDKDKPLVDLTGCKDIILVDRKYFLDHKETITRLASSLKRTLRKEDSKNVCERCKN